MPASGPVYQPTTVSYEQQNEWSRPGSYLSQTMSNSMRGPRCIQWLLLALGIFSVSAGIIMVVEGTVDFTDTHKHELEDEKGNIITPGSSTTDLVITITGVLLIILGILFLGVYVRLIRRRKGCPFFPTKEQRLARQLDTQVANGQVRKIIFRLIVYKLISNTNLSNVHCNYKECNFLFFCFLYTCHRPLCL